MAKLKMAETNVIIIDKPKKKRIKDFNPRDSKT